MQKQQTISWLDYDMRWKVDFIWQLATTTSVVGPRSSSKAFPKAKLAPKKGHGNCLVVCCPSDPLQLSEAQWNHYIWEVCSANQCNTPRTAKPAASIGQQKGPNSSQWQSLTTHHTINASKVDQIELQSFAIFTWPLTNQPPLLQASQQLFQGKLFHNQQEAENAFHVFVKSWSTDFTLQE